MDYRWRTKDEVDAISGMHVLFAAGECTSSSFQSQGLACNRCTHAQEVDAAHGMYTLYVVGQKFPAPPLPPSLLERLLAGLQLAGERAGGQLANILYKLKCH